MLNLQTFRKIKPINAEDDWIAGQDFRGNNEPSTVAKGKLYREQITALLSNSAPKTVGTISDNLGIGNKVTAAIIQKMVRAGVVNKADKIIGPSGRKSYGYGLA